MTQVRPLFAVILPLHFFFGCTFKKLCNAGTAETGSWLVAQNKCVPYLAANSKVLQS